ncbi:DDE family endonuclease isoform X1 [Wolffia australiana]
MAECKRWIVTYTKHLRQKRKVYQDGVLEFHCSSNKVLLYDDTQKLLESRMLKKDEIIDAGTTLTFEAHLVDVGDFDKSHHATQDIFSTVNQGKPRVKLENVQKSVGRTFHVQKNIQGGGKSTTVCSNIVNDKDREWIVMYTSQITQKAKRYHDGILKLVASGLHTAQLMLLNEAGSMLCSKFHQLSKCLAVGDTFEMPNYLVEICGQQNVMGECSENKVPSMRETTSLGAAMPTKVEIPLIKPRDDQSMCSESRVQSRRKNARLGASRSMKAEAPIIKYHDESKASNMQETVSSGAAMFIKVEVPVIKPRDAFQILSVLKRPQKETVAMELTCSSQPIELIHCDSQIKESLCEEEDQGGSSSTLPGTLSQRDDTRENSTQDREVKSPEQETLVMDGPQTTLVAQNIKNAQASTSLPKEGTLEPVSGCQSESGLNGDELPVPEKENNSLKMFSKLEEQGEDAPSAPASPPASETDNCFPSFDLGF